MSTINNTSKDSTPNFINEIKYKIMLMKRSEYRTTNFSIIEYFANNDFKPLLLNSLISQLIKDYKSNPKKYVLAHENVPFKSLSNFKSSSQSSIKRNKVFFNGPGDGQLSVNLKYVKHYLNTMFGRYTSNSKDVKTPIKMFSKKKRQRPAQIKKPIIPVINLTSVQTNENENGKENEPITIDQSSEQILDNNNNILNANDNSTNYINDNSTYYINENGNNLINDNDISTTNNDIRENISDNSKNIYTVNELIKI